MQHLFLYTIISAYALFAIYIALGWWRAVTSAAAKPVKYSKASIIIPFRNEEKRLMTLVTSIKIICDLNKDLEFIFVDDHSDDGSLDMLLVEFDELDQVHVLRLPKQLSGKKSAIAFGISYAQNNHIITTDADCELNNEAILSMLYNLEPADKKMVCGLVLQYSGKGFAGRLADLEFLSLIGSGISCWGNDMPLMANGAFLGFKKDAFESVNGFGGNEQFPGGDDVFLLHKFQIRFGKKSIHFLTHHTDIIQTVGDTSLHEFIERRIRWGSKARAYSGFGPKLLTLYILWINIFLLFGWMFFAVNGSWWFVIYTCTLKIICDVLMLAPMLIRLNKWELLPYIFPASIVHPFYLLFSGMLAISGKYSWKKRLYKH